MPAFLLILRLFMPDLLLSGPQSLDELDDDEPGERERREEEALVQANTYQNEAMAAEPDPDQPLVGPLSLDFYLLCFSSFACETV